MKTINKVRKFIAELSIVSLEERQMFLRSNSPFPSSEMYESCSEYASLADRIEAKKNFIRGLK